LQIPGRLNNKTGVVPVFLNPYLKAVPMDKFSDSVLFKKPFKDRTAVLGLIEAGFACFFV